MIAKHAQTKMGGTGRYNVHGRLGSKRSVVPEVVMIEVPEELWAWGPFNMRWLFRLSMNHGVSWKRNGGARELATGHSAPSQPPRENGCRGFACRETLPGYPASSPRPHP